MPKQLTYSQARKQLFAQLESDGWEVSVFSHRTIKPLKVPYATSPNSDCKLWFKPEATYMSDNGNTLSNARSLHMDIREIPQDQLRIVGGYFDRLYERSC